MHISELAATRVSQAEVEATFKAGETMDVKFLGKNDKGQMRLSRRAVRIMLYYVLVLPPSFSAVCDGLFVSLSLTHLLLPACIL